LRWWWWRGGWWWRGWGRAGREGVGAGAGVCGLLAGRGGGEDAQRRVTAARLDAQRRPGRRLRPSECGAGAPARRCECGHSAAGRSAEPPPPTVRPGSWAAWASESAWALLHRHVRRRISLGPPPGAEEAAKASTVKDPAREAAGLISTRRRRVIAWASGPPGALGRGSGAGPCGALGAAWPHARGLNYAGDTGPVAQRDARI
jgi:hypothetical protein